MTPLKFLMDGHTWYNYMNATVAQGLTDLGHVVYGLNSSDNYCLPYSGKPYDVIIQAWTQSSFKSSKPRIFLFGDDVPPNQDPCDHIPWNRIKADAYFVRDFIGSNIPNVFPMNFGIETRYYCSTELKTRPLKDRKYDITFLGRWDNCPHRSQLLARVKSVLTSDGFRVNIEKSRYSEPDDYWSRWVKGHCTHDPRYFDVLADSKLILSPMGLGPDCARHWEALASGGIPLIQRMPTTMVPPQLVHGQDCLFFSDADEAIDLVRSTLGDSINGHSIAVSAYATGLAYHTTLKRAQYVLDCAKDLI